MRHMVFLLGVAIPGVVSALAMSGGTELRAFLLKHRTCRCRLAVRNFGKQLPIFHLVWKMWVVGAQPAPAPACSGVTTPVVLRLSRPASRTGQEMAPFCVVRYIYLQVNRASLWHTEHPVTDTHIHSHIHIQIHIDTCIHNFMPTLCVDRSMYWICQYRTARTGCKSSNTAKPAKTNLYPRQGAGESFVYQNKVNWHMLGSQSDLTTLCWHSSAPSRCFLAVCGASWFIVLILSSWITKTYSQ
jgi:hypothetical protein